ncbi:SUN domain-containing ossification factor [Diabrotica undecimpunctata]|uniref:SUN domain-containing ossification factor n=1 Tax=Diabrotica undecimpunctata TaxID=50387 RepID=UPI003B63F142
MKNGTVTIVLNVVLFLIGIPCINLEDVNTVLNPTNSLVQNESIRDYQESDKVEEKLANIEPVLETILEPSVNVEESVKVAIDSESLEGQKGPNTENDKSEVPNRVIDDTPILLSTESSTVELDQLSDISVVLTSQNEEIASKKILETENVNIPINISANTSETEEKKVEETVVQIEESEKNATEGKTEDIPSFSEWAQKRLEEVEKNEQINSSMKGNQVPNGKTQNAKLRWKNYASLDCGAKVVAANPEAISPGAILSPSSDEYKLNPCTSRIWFVVELCEAIQAKKIDLANYELFSSSPKEFTVSVSERFPTRDWAQVGKFTAEDERDIQSFDLDTELFGKYIKVEIKSHYGSEHYCPISLFRAYGASVFEVLQKEDVNRPDDDDDEDEDDEENDLNSSQTDKKNLFSSATDAVMSVMKRAAQILGTKSNDDSQKSKNSSASTLINTCSSPRHIISCQKCNETLYGQIYELLSCKAEEIRRIVSISSIYKTLISSCICKKFGYDFKNHSDRNYLIKNIEAFFPEPYIGAMCNEAAILENYGVLNVSQQFSNITKKISNEKLIEMNIEIQEVRVVESVTSSDILQNNTITNVSTDEIAQIKPTKTLTVNETLPKTDTQGTPSESVASVETVTELPETGAIFPDSTTEGTFVSEGDVSTEGTDVLDDQLNNIISDLTAEGPNTVVASSASANSPQAAKESIFLRLFNRIKALERNMSLSSQYLEELSKRYKKQVEEMREETQKRDELNKQLEERLDKLTATIENMAAERRTFLSVVYCLLFFGLSCLGIYFFCGKRPEVSRDREEVPSAGRRKSVDELKKEEKKRRPSDQVLKIVRYSSLNEDRKSKKKKKKIYHSRSISLGSIKLDKEKWPEEGEGRSMIEEVPVVLDESDNSILDGCKLSKEVEIEGQSKSSQTEIECRNEENNLSTYANLISNEPIKKEKKGLKRLLKKVF